MAKQSKYVSYVGKCVNEVSEFKVPSSQNYLITGYDNPLRVSASGKRYRSYKLQLENGVWIGIPTFNKYVKRGYFSKQVVKKVQDSKVVKVFDFDNNELPFIEVKPTTKVKTSRLSIDDLLDIHEQVVNEISDITVHLANVLLDDFTNINWTTGELKYNNFSDYYEENVAIWLEKYEYALENDANDEKNVFTYYEWKYTFEPMFKELMQGLWEINLENARKTQTYNFFDKYRLLNSHKDAKKLHKQLARKYHTDNLETGNVEMFKVIQAGWELYINNYESKQRKNKKTVLTQQTQQAGKLYLLA